MGEMTMDDFKNEIERSVTLLKEGDIIKCIVTDVEDEQVTVDLNYYTDGIILLEECSDDPAFSPKDEIRCGQELSVMVLNTDSESVLLSLKKAKELHVWEDLMEDFEAHTVFTLKISSSVNGGVITFLKGIRAFIPVSQISLEYVENTSDWVGKTVDCIIMELDENSKKLILSSKAPAKEKAVLEKNTKIGRLVPGTILQGKIERIESYGVFVNMGDELTGLVHISQITDRFIKSPKEVVRLGDTINVKILGIDGDRIRLSMKDITKKAEDSYAAHSESLEYHDTTADQPSDYMANLLKDIQL